MNCITPITIKNPKPNILGTGVYMEVPCSRCTTCLKRRASQWMFRLQIEEQRSATAAFLTLTYNEEQCPRTEEGLLNLDKRHHTLFMKRLRKQMAKDGWDAKKVPLKYYMVGEYGGQTERPHYHSILFNLPTFYRNNESYIQKIWSHGQIQIDEVTPASIAYVCGYVNKLKHFNNLGENDDRQKEFTRVSKGMGLNYLTPNRIKSMQKKLNPFLTIEDGKKIPLPRYYKDKVFTEEQKSIIAQKALAHVEQNPQFESTIDHIEYVKQSNYKRNRDSHTKRNTI